MNTTPFLLDTIGYLLALLVIGFMIYVLVRDYFDHRTAVHELAHWLNNNIDAGVKVPFIKKFPVRKDLSTEERVDFEEVLQEYTKYLPKRAKKVARRMLRADSKSITDAFVNEILEQLTEDKNRKFVEDFANEVIISSLKLPDKKDNE